jgi:hypothetical protein
MRTLPTALFNAMPLSVEAVAMEVWRFVPLSLVPDGSPLALGASPFAPTWTFTPLPQRARTMPARMLGSFNAHVAMDTAAHPVCQVARCCHRNFVPLYTLIEHAKNGAIQPARMSKWTKPTRMPPSLSANKEGVDKVCLRMRPFCVTTRITLGRLAPAKPLMHPTSAFPVKLEPAKMGSFRIQHSRARKLEETQAVSQARFHGVLSLVWVDRARAVCLSQARFHVRHTQPAIRQPSTNALAAMAADVQLAA